MTLKLLLAAGLVAAATASSCASFSTCGDCIGKGLFCGWCSPSPTIFSNGTKGSQCQDQHAIGWHCDHLYSTDKCQQGYACNQTAGQCQLTAAGEGDTKANCEKHCTKIVPPAGLSVCDAKTHTCTPCKDYCHSDSDCPGSYCNGGLCHGSTCQQEYKCNATYVLFKRGRARACMWCGERVWKKQKKRLRAYAFGGHPIVSKAGAHTAGRRSGAGRRRGWLSGAHAITMRWRCPRARALDLQI